MLTLGGHVVQLALMVFFHYCRLNAATQEYDCCLVKPMYIYIIYKVHMYAQFTIHKQLYCYVVTYVKTYLDN